MTDQKQFEGILNTDDSNEVINPHHHKDARNVVFRNGRFENVMGTTVIPNSFLPGGGSQNVCVGSFFDNVRMIIYWFNYNNAGHNALYYYNIVTGALGYVILQGINADTGVLELSLTRPIASIVIIYGDTTQGDTIYWLDSEKNPCRINITKAIAGSYGTIKRQYIDVAKQPPDIPPQVVYEDDSSVTVNNMRKHLFKAKTRYVFENLDKSVWSAHSTMPIPYYYGQTEIDADPTKNADIFIAFQTGPSNVKKIEIAMAVGNGNVFSDFFLVTVIDKVQSSIPNDDVSTFRFYNDQGYINVDLQESIQLFDYVPKEANAQELLNGNSIIYGGVLEGYPNLIEFSNGTSATAISEDTEPSYTSSRPSILFATQGGKSVYNAPANIHIIVAGTVHIGDAHTVTTDTGVVFYVATAPTTTNVITGLAASAVVAGFVVVSSDANNLIISKAATNLLDSQVVYEPTFYVSTDSVFAYDWWSKYGMGFVYFDTKGRTDGVVYPANFATQTEGISETLTLGTDNIPEIKISVYHRPPDFAYYVHIVRTKNLTKSKLVQWVSDRTFKDTSPEENGFSYAYISIESLNTFVLQNKNSPLAYSFSPNDRIRFMKLFNVDGTTNQVYGNDKDFEIQDSVTNPLINGVQYSGQFVKILLPTTSGTFDFGTQAFFNYQIELYTPAQPVANGLNFYYEFGERYAIIDPTLTTRRHEGQTQNQSSDLVTPALYAFTLGDDFYRERKVNAGAVIDYVMAAGALNDGDITLGVNFQSQSYNDPNILVGSSPLLDLAGFNLFTNDDRWLLKIVTGPFIFRLKGTINVQFDLSENYAFWIEDNATNRTYLVGTGYFFVEKGAHVFNVDVTFSLASGDRIFIFGFSQLNISNTKTFVQTNLQITRVLSFTSGFIDPNFSDLYPSALNSNGRAWIYDPNANSTFFGTLLRWGLAYEVDTNINNTNRFYPLNFDAVDNSRGDIERLKSRDRICRIFQNRACGQVGVYAKFIQDSNGTNTLTTTDEIITKNNVQYYEGNYGIGNHPESLLSTPNDDWFIDPVLGEHIRLASNGLFSVSKNYYGKYYIKSLLIPYNKDWVTITGGNALVLQYYDYTENQVGVILQAGTNGSDTISNYNFSFNDRRNAYLGFYDFFPQWVMGAEDKIYSWQDGSLYIHNNTTTYCKFYNVQFYPSATPVFNDKVNIKKTFNATSYQANQIWVSDTNGDILTSQINDQTGLSQISSLIASDYQLQEWLRYAAFLRDANSGSNAAIALLEGDVLKGVWIQVKYTYKGSNFAYIYLPTINFSISNRNY